MSEIRSTSGGDNPEELPALSSSSLRERVYTVTPESALQGQVAADSLVSGSPRRGEKVKGSFLDRLTRTAHVGEQVGWAGILVPHNLHEVDPWPIASYLGSVTSKMVPLIALQPSSLPPHTAAAMASAYATLYGRPLYFNLVAGAREDELRSTGDELGHDERYERVREYGRILRALLRGEAVTEEGRHYTYRDFRLQPRPEVLSECKIFIAGSSSASLSVARDIADVVVTHPAPYPEWEAEFLRPLLAEGYAGEFGIRIGVIARQRRADAWDIARTRFPETWRGRQETLLKTMSPNAWSRKLAQHAVTQEGREGQFGAEAEEDPYWLGAFRSGGASAPFLVGDVEEVADRLGAYLRAGVGHILLNGSHEDDHADIRRVIDTAAASRK
ncbi:LLM class flavin-dependent oxidoreductase [Streptomyces uncialis]|uniref:LLM class flavin-dependent oxidoreductase n=1 Tax=Streptomyces uncialis TaxID=1048205 RepID=UPI0036671DC5